MPFVKTVNFYHFKKRRVKLWHLSLCVWFISSRSASCCRRCGGGWGWTSRWTLTCPSAPGPPWWVDPTKSSPTSSTTRSPFLPTHLAGQTLTMPRCWCGGPGEERHSWSYRQNRKAKCLYTSAVSGSLCAEEEVHRWGKHTACRGKVMWWCPRFWRVKPRKNRLMGGILSRVLWPGSSPKSEWNLQWTRAKALACFVACFLPAFYWRGFFLRGLWGCRRVRPLRKRHPPFF